MSNFFEVKNIFINQTVKNKEEAFQKVMQVFLDNQAVLPEYLESMKKRDAESSVALGNFLALPHGAAGSDSLILKNCVTLFHLTKPFEWDGQEIRFIFALALKNSNQIEFIQKAGIAFSDIDEIEDILNKKDLTPEFLLNWIESQ